MSEPVNLTDAQRLGLSLEAEDGGPVLLRSEEKSLCALGLLDRSPITGACTITAAGREALAASQERQK